MGYTSIERVQIRLDVNPTSEDPTTTSGSQGPPLSGGGDTEARSQGWHEEGHLLSKSIPQLDFSGSQERQIGEVGDQPETPEPVHPPNPFQDGESGYD